MKTTRLMILWVLIMAVAGMAQQGYKLAVINPNKVFENSTEGKKVAVQIQEKSQQIQKELAKKDEQIRTLETKLNTQRQTLTAEALVQVQNDLENMSIDRKRMEEDATRDFEKLRVMLFTKIRNDIMPIIEAAAKEKGFDVVLDASTGGSVIFFQPSVDITDDVIKRYNANRRPNDPQG